ncbi:dCTP pyrophosphatase 1-like protein [Dinothrombium tinctorium]|uniref:dCTP pyrophosphatase 1 n=1 Tax=Dinothrombium tinctorium TaxID=1965070 RepID=A0A443RBN0_9ACAR|nr:dCTP pyrophosphatase 1-like protein [Dinothrombium tinctorium]
MDANDVKNGHVESERSEFKFSSDLSLENLRRLQSEFCEKRNWQQYHTPRNLLLAMTGEIGELCEIFQWKSDEQCAAIDHWSSEERTHLGEELSDVLIYLIRLAEVCHIDLCSAVLQKIKLNARKYPIEKAYGSSKKYSQL